MIRNVFGKALTRSTAEKYPEMEIDDDTTTREGLARWALAMKNSHGTGADEVAALRYVHRLKARCERELCGFTQGWMYNATGSAISLVDCSNWNGAVISNPFPLRIDNGQYGMFIQEKLSLVPGEGCGAVLYRGLNADGIHCFWCIAWKSEGIWQQSKTKQSKTNVHTKIVRDVDWEEDNCWESVRTAIQETCPLHKANNEGLYSIITTSYGNQAVFEALLTLETTSNY